MTNANGSVTNAAGEFLGWNDDRDDSQPCKVCEACGCPDDECENEEVSG